MTTMTICVKLIMSILLLVLGSAIIFISQVYSPSVLWILSFSLLVGSIGLGVYVTRRFRRLLLTLIFSLIINGNFLLHVPYGNPVIVMLLYGLGLAVLSWALLFSLAEIAASMMSQRGHSLAGQD